MPPPHERNLTVIQGQGNADMEPRRIDNIPAFLDQLHALRVGLPITFQPQDGEAVRLGHFVQINPTTDLVIMNDGLMQLRQTNPLHGNHYPLSGLASSMHGATAEDARDDFLSFRRNAIDETVIDNTDQEHQSTFVDALTHVEGLIARRRLALKATKEMLGSTAPKDMPELAEQSEALNVEVSETIDDLAKEKLGKAIMNDKNALIGYAIPAPIEGTGPNSYLFLFKTGNIYGVEIVEDTEASRQFASQNSTEVTSFTYLEPESYTVITSNTTEGDPTLLTQHYAAAGKWLDEKREERKRHLANENQTRNLLVQAREGLTEPTIEEKAREILGKDFLGVEEVRKVENYINTHNPDVSMEFDLDEVPPIPFTVKDLEVAKKNGEMLVLRPGSVINEFSQDLTLADFRRYFAEGNIPIDEQPIFQPGHFRMDHEYAALPGEIELEWALVKKQVIGNSIYHTWDEQETALREYANSVGNAEAADSTNVRRRTAMEATWDTVLYYINTGEKLLMDISDFTSSVDNNKHIVVGHWDPTLFISEGPTSHERYSNIGVVSSRHR